MKSQTMLVGAVMLFVGILIGYLGHGSTAPGNQANQPKPATLMDPIVSQTRHFKGDPKAPVTMVEFSDFQCPYCGRFALTTIPEIENAYVKKGLVRLGYQHFIFLGEESQWAAEASECAADQQNFWPYHDRLVKRLAAENQRDFSKETLKAFAAELKLEPKAFASCLDSGKYASLVQGETTRAQAVGVSSTPTFLINGVPLVGAQPFSVFQKALEQAAKPGS